MGLERCIGQRGRQEYLLKVSLTLDIAPFRFPAHFLGVHISVYDLLTSSKSETSRRADHEIYRQRGQRENKVIPFGQAGGCNRLTNRNPQVSL